MKDKKTSDFWNDSTYSEYHQSLFFWSCYSFLLLIKFSAFTSTVKGARIVWRKHRLVSKESDNENRPPTYPCVMTTSTRSFCVQNIATIWLQKKILLKIHYRDNGFIRCSKNQKVKVVMYILYDFNNPLIKKVK